MGVELYGYGSSKARRFWDFSIVQRTTDFLQLQSILFTPGLHSDIAAVGLRNSQVLVFMRCQASREGNNIGKPALAGIKVNNQVIEQL